MNKSTPSKNCSQTLSIEDADKLVIEHKGWAESIARSVARGWNMDWQSDGLDGAALEALIFCSRRFEPGRGVPFRGYARKRIHEASTEAARKSKGWRRSTSPSAKAEQEARQISAELFNIFPELRSGQLPLLEEASADSEHEVRSALRHLIVGASILAVREGINTSMPDEIVDYKRLIEKMSHLEPVHQAMLWKIYWEGESLRSVAGSWNTDELNVIREHKVLLGWLLKSMSTSKELQRPRIRPGLKPVALKLKRTSPQGQFSRVVSRL